MGAPGDSCVIDGVACRKNLAHKRMRRRIEAPRILMIAGNLEFGRAQGRLASLDSFTKEQVPVKGSKGWVNLLFGLTHHSPPLRALGCSQNTLMNPPPQVLTMLTLWTPIRQAMHDKYDSVDLAKQGCVGMLGGVWRICARPQQFGNKAEARDLSVHACCVRNCKARCASSH